MTSKMKRGKYLPLPTLYPNIFLTECDIDMVMVQLYVAGVNLYTREHQIISTYSCSAISIQNRLE